MIYASGIKGKAGLSPENLAEDLGPLFEAIIRCIPGPRIDKDGALQMLVSGLSCYVVMSTCCLYYAVSYLFRLLVVAISSIYRQSI